MADRFTALTQGRRCLELLPNQVYGHINAITYPVGWLTPSGRKLKQEHIVPRGTVSVARWWDYENGDRRYVHVVGGRHDALRGTYEIELRMSKEQHQLDEFVGAILQIEDAIRTHSPLLDKMWPHLTAPFNAKIIANRRDRERLRNWLKRDAFLKLSRARRGKDKRHRTNRWAVLWQFVAARQFGLEPRIQDLHTMRSRVKARSEVLWHENVRCRAIWSNLRTLTKSALWRKDPAGALRQPNRQQAAKLRVNLQHCASDLRTLLLRPDLEARDFALVDLEQLDQRLEVLERDGSSLMDTGFTRAIELAAKVYTGCRGVDLVEELGLGLLLDIGITAALEEEPRPAAHVVYSNCEMLIDWLERVRDEPLERPFSVGALRMLGQTRDAAASVLRGTVDPVEAMLEARRCVDACIQHIAYGTQV